MENANGGERVVFWDSADSFPASKDFLLFRERFPCHAGNAPGRNARDAPCPSRDARGRTGAGAAHLTGDSQNSNEKGFGRGLSPSWATVGRAWPGLPRELPGTFAPPSSTKRPRRRGRAAQRARMEVLSPVTCNAARGPMAVPMAGGGRPSSSPAVAGGS